jgi:hypothetical protein
MKKLMLTAAILAGAVTTAHAYDATQPLGRDTSLEAAGSGGKRLRYRPTN